VKATTLVPGTDWPVIGVGCRTGRHGALCKPCDSRPLDKSKWPLRVDGMLVWCSCDCHAVERGDDQLSLL
jgi:hypothetical protein